MGAYLRTLLVIVLLSFPINSFGFEHTPWRLHNTILQTAVVTSQVADWAQTRQIVHNEPGQNRVYEQANPLLRHNPGIIDIYFPVTIVLTAGVAYILPEPYRTVFQSGALVFSVVMIERNRALGVKIKF